MAVAPSEKVCIATTQLGSCWGKDQHHHASSLTNTAYFLKAISKRGVLSSLISLTANDPSAVRYYKNRQQNERVGLGPRQSLLAEHIVGAC